ncbi:MAG: hypothetical protein ABIH27_00120 [Candidatus Omnitrophota bacterium]
MKNWKIIFTGLLIITIIILIGVFQYMNLLKIQNDLIMVNVECIRKQIVSFEYRNNNERWNARITVLTNDNKELKNKIAVLEAILAQEAIKPESGKAKETPKRIKPESGKAKETPEGNKGFLYKKR